MLVVDIILKYYHVGELLIIKIKYNLKIIFKILLDYYII